MRPPPFFKETILVLDGKVHRLGGVRINGCGFKGRENVRAARGGKDI